MKPKKYIKRKSDIAGANAREALGAIKEDFQPIVDKVGSPVTSWAKRNPKVAFILMLGIVIANFCILFFFTDVYKVQKNVDSPVSKIHFSGRDYSGIQIPDIDISLANINKVRKMKDSLEYLMTLKDKMTYQDTLTFIRIMDQFQDLTKGKDKDIPALSLDQLRALKDKQVK